MTNASLSSTPAGSSSASAAASDAAASAGSAASAAANSAAQSTTQPAELPTVRIGVLGCGTVGTQVVRLLLEQSEDFAARVGARLEVTGVAVRSLATKRDAAVPVDLLTEDAHAVATSNDLVVELIGGIEPARSLILEAFASGASVITGNKALIAEHGPQLFDAAGEAGVDFYYEAAVAGAIPVVYSLRESMAGDQIRSVLGIVNGTTNYILDEMSVKGLSFDEALAQAQALGYAEADPTADVDGFDAAAKAAIIASLAFHSRVSLSDVTVEGIRSVTAEDIREAHASGCELKLLAIAQRRDDDHASGISVRVHPTLVPQDHPLANVHGAYNAVLIEAEAAGRLMFYGQGAGGTPTASAVLSDVVAAATHRVHGGQAPRENSYAELPILGPESALTRYQLQIRLTDQPGALATVATTLAAQEVSIDSVRQSRYVGGEDAVLTVVTHRAPVAHLDAALAGLRALQGVQEILSVHRVEGD